MLEVNETAYWIIEYAKVFIAYMLITFVWPRVVFHRFLKEKSKTFIFAFCVCVMMTLGSGVILVLGSVHLLNVWVIRILFYGTFIAALFYNNRFDKEKFKFIRKSVTGTMGRKTLTRGIASAISKYAVIVFKKVVAFFKGNTLLYGLLLLLLGYTMLYFTWNAFQNYSYGASDMYLHNKWVYGLVQGNAFSEGIYPEGMHCFIYAIHALFGIRIYSCFLFVAGINIGTMMLCAFLMFKEIFRWKYAPVIALTLFSIMDVKDIYPVLSYGRLGWTIPQEFAYPMVFLCGAFLLRFLKEKTREQKETLKEELKKKKINDNLMIFALAIAGTIAIHFYATIIAFFICLMLVIPYTYKLFRQRRFLKLSVTVAAGLLIAVLPMLIAFASGKKFQGSINWAISVIKNSIISERVIDYDTEDNLMAYLKDKKDDFLHIEQICFAGNDVGKVVRGKTVRAGQNPIQRMIKKIYNRDYLFMYGEGRATWILVFEGIALLLWAAYRIAGIFIGKKNKKFRGDRYDGYAGLLLMGVAFTILNHPDAIGLPEIFELGRICAVTQLLALGIFLVPIDLLMSFPLYRIPGIPSAVIGVAGLVSSIVLTVATGDYHGYSFYCLGRYNGAVKSTISITEDVKPQEFTIVSTTDELYQFIQYGYHEEVIDFINSVTYKYSYTLPTRYVFIFVEKRPIQYPHYHFASGPKWLALEKYAPYFGSYVSQNPDIIQTELKDKYVTTNTGMFSNKSEEVYTDLQTRAILESKLNAWCEKFDELYPGELHTYYEDDDFVCYYFEQNQRNIYELSIVDWNQYKNH
ncbi:MAG: hypothetical protein K5776_12180 [Lachnospiraceae bacterium]|nr:hypothetical protein [Lachnospiraceae bacterium]